MRGKKKEPTPIAKIRKSGIVQRDLSPAYRAGRYWRGAYYMLPKFNLWIKLSCLVALMGALACLVVVFTRPRPILMVSFPDGTTVCSLPPLDPATGRILPRPSQEAQLCATLAQRSGRGTDEETAEFAKASQVEPPAEERQDLQVPAAGPTAQPVVPAPASSTVAPSDLPAVPLEVQPSAAEAAPAPTATQAPPAAAGSAVVQGGA